MRNRFNRLLGAGLAAVFVGLAAEAQQVRAEHSAVSRVFTVDTAWNEWPGEISASHETASESLAFTIGTGWQVWPGHKEPPFVGTGSVALSGDSAFANFTGSGESGVFAINSQRLSFEATSAQYEWVDPERIRVTVVATNLGVSAVPLDLEVSLLGGTLFEPQGTDTSVVLANNSGTSLIVSLSGFRDAQGASLERDTPYLVRAVLREGGFEISPLEAGSLEWRSEQSTPNLEWESVVPVDAGDDATVVGSFRYRDPINAVTNLALAATSDGGITWDQIEVSTVDGTLQVATTAEWQSAEIVWHAGLDWLENVSPLVQLALLNTGTGEFVASSSFLLDTRSLLRIRDISSPYSSFTRSAVFLDGVPVTVSLAVAPDWGKRTPGFVEFQLPTGIVRQSAAELSYDLLAGGQLGENGRVRARLVDGEGTLGDWYDANVTAAPLPAGLDGLAFEAVPAPSEGLIRYKQRAAASVPAQAFVSSAPASVDDLFPMLDGQELGAAESTMDIEVLVSSLGSGEIRGTGALMYAMGEQVASELAVSVLLSYDQDGGRWQVDSTSQEAGSLETRVPVVEVEGPTALNPPAVLLGGALPVAVGGDFFVDEIVDFLSFSGEIAFTGNDVWNYAGASGQGMVTSMAMGARVEQRIQPHPANVRGFGAIAAGGDFRIALLGYESGATTWSMSWSETGGGSREGGARNSGWTVLPRDYQSADNPLTALESNVFPYSQPALAPIGDDLALIWVGDDATRSIENRMSLQFRTHNGSWQSATEVDDDGTADSAPYAVPTAAGFSVIWQNTASELSPGATIADMARLQEISVRHYNATTESWSGIETLTGAVLGNDPLLYDFSPRMAAATNGDLIAVWGRNNSNSLTATESEPNVLLFSVRTDTWSTPGAVSGGAGVGSLIHHDLQIVGDEAILLATLDVDFDFSTSLDRELFVARYDLVAESWSTLTQITANEVVDQGAVVHEKDGAAWVIWWQDGVLVEAPLSDVAQATQIAATDGALASSEFVAARDSSGAISALVWPTRVDGRQALVAASLGGEGSWSSPVPLDDSFDFERSPAAAIDGAGALWVARNVARTEDGVAGVISPLEPSEVAFQGVDRQRMALAVDVIDLLPDLTVTFAGGLSVDAGTASIPVVVHNVGLGLAGASQVSIRVGGATGTERTTLAVDALAPGSSVSVDASWQEPGATIARLAAVADASASLSELDETNNSVELTTDAPDLQVARALSEQVEQEQELTLVVVNAGGVGASASTARVHTDAATLEDLAVPALAPLETVTITTRIALGQDVFLSLDVNEVVAELNELNNSVRLPGQDARATLPSIAPSGGVLSRPTPVAIRSAPGTVVYYTTDGTQPTTESTPYTVPFVVDSWMEVQAISVLGGGQVSPTAVAIFTYDGEPEPPEIQSISVTAVEGDAYAASLTAVASGNGLSYEWSIEPFAFLFGENGTSGAQTIVASVFEAGSYTVTLTVTNDDGLVDSAAILLRAPFDLDGDDIPDEWEDRFFANLEEGRDGDPDGDGVSNLVELDVGGNPTEDERLLIQTVLPGNLDTPSTGVDVAEQQAVNENETLGFSVAFVGGIPPLTIRWFEDGAATSNTSTSYTLAPSFDAVQHPASERDITVVFSVEDAAGQSSSALWSAVRFDDVDRIAPAPSVSLTPQPARTLHAIDLVVDEQLADPDGDVIAGYEVAWEEDGGATHAGMTLPSALTRKGHHWTATVHPLTQPYLADVVENASAAVSTSIENTPPTAGATTQTMQTGTSTTLQLAVQDPDVNEGRDSLTFHVLQEPALGTLGAFSDQTSRVGYAAGSFRGGTDTALFYVSDESDAESASAVVTVLVEWQLSLDVAGGPDATLVLGTSDVASSDVGEEDVLAAETAGNKACWLRNGTELSTDLLPVTRSDTWTLMVDASRGPGEVTVSWQAQDLLESGLYLLETEQSGDPLSDAELIILSEVPSVTATSGQQRWFTLYYGAVPYVADRERGWHLVSHPITIPDGQLAHWRSIGLQGGYTWDGSRLAFEEAWLAGVGYFSFWSLNRAPAAFDGELEEPQVRTYAPGWHMIGARSLPPFQSQALAEVVANSADVLVVWRWHPLQRAYRLYDGDLVPGEGYWIYVSP